MAYSAHARPISNFSPVDKLSRNCSMDRCGLNRGIAEETIVNVQNVKTYNKKTYKTYNVKKLFFNV